MSLHSLSINHNDGEDSDDEGEVTTDDDQNDYDSVYRDENASETSTQFIPYPINAKSLKKSFSSTSVANAASGFNTFLTIQQYISELGRLRMRQLDSGAYVTLAVEEFVSIHLEGVDEKNVVQLKKTIETFWPAASTEIQDFPFHEMRDDDDDSFIVFAEDEIVGKNSGQEIQTNDVDNKILVVETEQSYHPINGILPTIRVPSRFIITISKLPPHPTICKIGLNVEIQQPHTYPQYPPRISLQNIRFMSRLKTHTLKLALRELLSHWSDSRLLEPSIEFIIIKLTQLLVSTSEETESSYSHSHSKSFHRFVASRTKLEKKFNPSYSVTSLAPSHYKKKNVILFKQKDYKNKFNTLLDKKVLTHLHSESGLYLTGKKNFSFKNEVTSNCELSVACQKESQLHLNKSIIPYNKYKNHNNKSPQYHVKRSNKNVLYFSHSPTSRDREIIVSNKRTHSEDSGTLELYKSSMYSKPYSVTNSHAVISIPSAEQLSVPADTGAYNIRNSSTYEASRYSRDFEELELLGVGAFGSVTKCRLRATGRKEDQEDAAIFAIKRILLSSCCERQNLALQKEAANLAVLHHPHIVRYHSAWIERIFFFDKPDTTLKRRDSSQNVYPRRGVKKTIIFNQQCAQYSSLSSSFSLKHLPPSSSQNPSSESLPLPRCLYIQMEYCSGQTLRKAIDTGRIYNHSGLIWVLFHQILDGLACMHSNGLIHRDLKPCNIFLQNGTGGEPLDMGNTNLNDVHIKIGDFGLTTSISETRTNSIGPNHTTGLHLSAGVGTKFYMAPEQEIGGVYDHKADMFSLGVVFFELWHLPFTTSMERAVVLSKLLSSERELPAEFLVSVPTIVPVILRQLLNASPFDRPSAQNLLQSVLIPGVPRHGEFQAVYAFMSRHPVSVETVHITAALYQRQLSQQMKSHMLCQGIGGVEKCLLPIPARATWCRSLALSEVSNQLAQVFMSRGAIRFETPILLPRTPKFGNTTPIGSIPFPGKSYLHPSISTLPLQQRQDDFLTNQHISISKDFIQKDSINTNDFKPEQSASSGLSPILPTSLNQFQHSRVFLDRHGTPVFIPNRLIAGFARTARDFLLSAPSVSRRFAIQNVHCTPSGSSGDIPSFSEHPHGFFDICVKLSSMLEPDTRTAVTATAAAAAKAAYHSDPHSITEFLLYILRSACPPPTSQNSLRKALRSMYRQLVAFPVLGLFEVEIMSVAFQALYAAVPQTKLFPFQFYWTHGLLLSAILREILDIPVELLSNLETELRWTEMPLTKAQLLNKLSALEPTRSHPKTSTHTNEFDKGKLELNASLLYQILSFEGSVQAWANFVVGLLPKCHPGSITDILLRHVSHIDQLIGASIPQTTIFSLTLPFDCSVFGKGVVFVVVPCHSKTADISQHVHPPCTSPMYVSNAASIEPASISRGQPHGGSLNMPSPRMNAIMGHANLSLFRDRIAIGGRYDFLVVELNIHTSALKSTGFFGFEISAGVLVDIVLGIPSAPSLYSSIPNSSIHSNKMTVSPIDMESCFFGSTSNSTNSGISSNGLLPSGANNLLKRLVARQVPQVFVIVVRAEQQIYAVNLRRLLLLKGIQCQRSVDRLVDASLFRRKAKNTSSVTWVVQLRDQPSSGIAYKLQYYGLTGNQPIETETVFDHEQKVVEYLANYFNSNTTSIDHNL